MISLQEKKMDLRLEELKLQQQVAETERIKALSEAAAAAEERRAAAADRNIVQQALLQLLSSKDNFRNSS